MQLLNQNVLEKQGLEMEKTHVVFVPQNHRLKGEGKDIKYEGVTATLRKDVSSRNGAICQMRVRDTLYFMTPRLSTGGRRLIADKRTR